MKISKAEHKDFQVILALQYAAYQSEAIRYDDFSIPPLTQTLDQLVCETKKGILLKATKGDAIVGSARGQLHGTTCKISRLIVHPNFQSRGIGSQLLSEIENCFAGAKLFELFTGTESYDNIRLYNRHGYTEFKEEKLTHKISLVFLQKRNQLSEQKQAGKGAFMMSDQFELFCEYFHCCGIKRMELGRAETETMAKQWKENQTRDKKRPLLPKAHLIITCPVKHCPAKLQIPRYDYRKTVA